MSKTEYFINLAIHHFERYGQSNPKTYFVCWVNDMTNVLRENAVDKFKLLELLLKQY
jgi:hypothetical protein